VRESGARFSTNEPEIANRRIKASGRMTIKKALPLAQSRAHRQENALR
jgi:hypothetical protein